MCRTCLQTHIEATVKDDYIACIICENPVKIPDPYRPRDEWSTQYPTDTFLDRMIKAGEQMEKTHNCFVCESSRGAVTVPTQYCFNCDTYYCDGCNELHLQLRGLQGHTIVPLKDLTTKDLMTRRVLYCTKHKDKLLDTYCRDPSAGKLPLVTPGPLSTRTPEKDVPARVIKETSVLEPSHVVCSVCAHELHKGMKTQSVTKAAKEITQRLQKVKSKIAAVIDTQEQRSSVLKEKCARVAGQKEAKISEIEAAFAKIQTALDARKECLLGMVDESCARNDKDLEHLSNRSNSYLSSLKDIRSLLTWLEECGTDVDLASSGDVIAAQFFNLYHMSTDPASHDLSVFRSNIHIQDSVVNTFVQLVNMIGSDPEGHVVAFKTKERTLKMPDDMYEPYIKDILLLEDGTLIATDNKNKSLKMAGVSDLGDPTLVRLHLKTEPWGVTKLQVNVIAVTGHQCVYIVTKTEELHLQSTVRTRKDYWSVTALSSINLALTCKFPPSIDVIDITGRKLRTIDTDGSGQALFKVPQYVASLYDKLLVSDREANTLTCVDQQGAAVFTFSGCSDQDLTDPKSVCASKNGRVFLVEGEEVWLLTAEGKLVNKLIKEIGGARAITEENGTLCVAVDGKGVAYYKVIDMNSV
ncbi:E3 ubiquitin-protein ligase TRIM71-like [Elysia marginata]|uniref:E3 ubiquitin-protein ligase TRIM71-like n=1 Tax=Elysia marginata TaxID=1093978 RepID=A0AAV4H483_9GAST|nr:E3 ubiquitin-protein ligase TRIM71-like [Elysia marginata]